MDFETYERLTRTDYATFAETVASILTAAIRRQPQSRLQQVQHRAKDPASLQKKLKERELLDTTTLEADIKDLAGCRLIFYTNSDVNRFLGSGIVHDNFEIDWDRTKIHHPSPDSDEAKDLFISNNYVVKLKEDRSALPEYARFRDMWCEVQVHTMLNHAWSETAHDTIYKQPRLKGFGGNLFKGIENRMQAIMRDHLLPAGYEFQKVLDDFERLSVGKALFDQGALEALTGCNDNNARHDLLQRFKEYILPYYDDMQSVYPDIHARIIATMKEARTTETSAIQTPFGAYSGHSIEEIVGIAADVLDYLRYVDVTATFDAICELFPGARSDVEQKRLLQSAERLSKHELDVWKHAGPFVQTLLVDRIQSLDDDLLDLLAPVLLTILGEVLKPEVTGTSSTYESITIHRGAVPASEALARVRAGAIAFLKKLFRKAGTDAERRAIIGALSRATATPHRGDYSNALLKNIFENTGEIVDFYTEMADSQSYEILQRLEHDLLWLYRRCRDLSTDAAADSEIAEKRDRLNRSIMTFRDQLNAERGFAVYKTLVGFESVFPPAWDNTDFDHNEERVYRGQRITELVKEVNEENAEEWLSILERCARTDSNDLATFPSFSCFLEQLGETKPHIVLRYLDRLDDPLSNFLPPMLRGLVKSGSRDEARGRVVQWISKKIYLNQIAWYLRFAEDFDPELLVKLLNAALENNDDAAVINAFGVAVARHKHCANDLIDTVFVPSLTYFTARRDTQWVHTVWHDPQAELLFRDLRPEQVDMVLANLIWQPRIEYHSEKVLTFVAESWPEKVIDFLGGRLELEVEQGVGTRFEPIPFNLHALQQPLSRIPDYIVDKTRAWFEQESRAFSTADWLPSIVFPEFSQGLRDKLTTLIRSGETRAIEFVISILRNYEGQVFSHDVLKKIIEALPPDDVLLDEISVILQSTGMVMGEFGCVAAYERKKTEIAPWLSDTREKVRSFAKSQLLRLDRLIAAEQRRSEEELEFRKRKFGDKGE